MNKSDISQYVSGKVEPNQDKLYVLAKALNVSEAWLMGYDVPMERSSDLGFTSSTSYDASNWMKHTANEQELLNHFSKLNLKGEEEAIKRVKELIYVPDYTENQEEWLIQIPGTRKLEKSIDVTEDDDSCDTTIRTLHTTFSLSDLIDTGNNSSSTLAAARNDHMDEEGEMEKTLSDIEKLRKLQK